MRPSSACRTAAAAPWSTSRSPTRCPTGHALLSVADPRPRHRPRRGDRAPSTRSPSAASRRSWPRSPGRSSSTATAASVARSPSRSPAGSRRPGATSTPSTSAAIFPFARPAALLGPPDPASPGRAAAQRPGLRQLAAVAGRRPRRARRRPGRPVHRPQPCATTRGSPRSYFTGLLSTRHGRLPARRSSRSSATATRPPSSTQERYREWHFLTDATAARGARRGRALLPQVPRRASWPRSSPAPGTADAETCRPVGPAVADAGGCPERLRTAPSRRGATRPSMGRFRAVAAGQLVSHDRARRSPSSPSRSGSTSSTGSLVRFALFAVLAPGAGHARRAARRRDRRPVRPAPGHARRRRRRRWRPGGRRSACCLDRPTRRSGTSTCCSRSLSVALDLPAPRLRLGRSPQLVPKHYLGHANGIVQPAIGAAQFLVPLIAVGAAGRDRAGGILSSTWSATRSRSDPARWSGSRARWPCAAASRCARRSPTGSATRCGDRGLPRDAVFFAALNLFLSRSCSCSRRWCSPSPRSREVGAGRARRRRRRRPRRPGDDRLGRPAADRRMRGVLIATLLHARRVAAVTGLRPNLGRDRRRRVRHVLRAHPGQRRSTPRSSRSRCRSGSTAGSSRSTR